MNIPGFPVSLAVGTGVNTGEAFLCGTVPLCCHHGVRMPGQFWIFLLFQRKDLTCRGRLMLFSIKDLRDAGDFELETCFGSKKTIEILLKQSHIKSLSSLC